MIPNGFDFYVPAIVIAVPNQDVAEDKFYTVLKSNNRRVSRTAFGKGLCPKAEVASVPLLFLRAMPSSFLALPGVLNK